MVNGFYLLVNDFYLVSFFRVERRTAETIRKGRAESRPGLHRSCKVMRGPGYLGAARREGQVLQTVHRFIKFEPATVSRQRTNFTMCRSPCDEAGNHAPPRVERP
jgi:hypothetical protein